MVYWIKVAKFWRRIVIRIIWNRQTVILNVRASLLLECMDSPDGECRSVSYGVVNIRKSVGELSDCIDWQEVRERINGQIGRGVVSYFSFCIDNCVNNSNQSHFLLLENVRIGRRINILTCQNKPFKK